MVTDDDEDDGVPIIPCGPLCQYPRKHAGPHSWQRA